MKRGTLWRISLATSPEAEDAVGELLATVLGLPPVLYTDAETGRSTATVFRSGSGGLSVAERKQLAAGLARLREAAPRIGPGRIRVSRIRREDWAESWKRHFQPIEIGSALLIKPSWSRRRPRAGQALVVLDPGLSFGTGQHPTTAFCLRQLVARREPDRRQAFLDIGTGSGILAIAAAKLGYGPVHALDVDPDAVRVAQGNARQNGVARQIRFSTQDFTKLPLGGRERYAVVCANLVATLLVAGRERILNRLQDDGVLVAAGILRREFADLQRTYRAAGLKLIASRSENEWRSGAFAFGRHRAAE